MEGARSPFLSNGVDSDAIWTDGSVQSKESYDPIKAQPYDANAIRKDGASTLGAIISIVCLTVGVGMISLPSATSKMGWITFPFLVVCAALSVYCAKILVRSMHSQPGWRLPSFTACSVAALSPISPLFTTLVTVLQCGLLFGCCCVFLVLMGTNMRELVGPPLTKHVWVFIFGIVLLPFSWLKGMKEAGHMAILGLSASLILAAVIIHEGLKTYRDTPDAQQPTRTIAVSDIGHLSVAFNIIVLSFGGHSCMPAIEESMKNPRHWDRVINISYSIICLIYAAVCLGGYLGFGASALGNILDNLNRSSWSVKAARVGITLHVVMTFNLLLVPFSHYVESAVGLHLKPEGRQRTVSMIILRSCIMLCAVFVASVVPYVSELVSLISALTVIGMAFIFPPLFYWRLESQLGSWMKAGLAIIIFIGIAGSALGIYFSIHDLIDAVRKHPNPFDHFFWE